MSTTGSTSGGYEVVQGPFQFGLATKLVKTKDQCLTDNAFADPTDECIRNPINCKDGLSFSFFFFPDYAETDSVLANPSTVFNREYLLSTGGEDGAPGFAVYREGGTLGVHVSTGEYNWKLEVVGGIPKRNKWSNIGVRWRPLQFNNSVDFGYKVKDGESEEDFGGLTLFIDLRRVGFVIIPQEIGCQQSIPGDCPTTTVKDALATPTVLIGCHKTEDDQTKRMFSSGVWDELAIWRRWMNDTQLAYFYGGYKEVFETMSSDEMVKMLDNVDMADPAQADSAIGIVDTLVSGIQVTTPYGDKYDTSTTTTTEAGLPGAGGPTATTTTTTTTTTKPPPLADTLSLEAKKIRDMLKVAMALTDTKGLAPALSARDFEIRFNAVNPVGEILSTKGRYTDQYKALNMNASMDMDAHMVRENTKNYLMELIQRRDFFGPKRDIPDYAGMRNSTTNFATEIIRLDALTFQGLGATHPESYFQFPNWKNERVWNKVKSNFGISMEPIDKVDVPSILFSGDCADNHVAMVSTIYDAFPDPGRKNPVTIPINKMKLDSKVIEVDVISIPRVDSKRKGQRCTPDLKLLIRRPLRLSFELKSGRNKSRGAIRDGTRSLKFHGDEQPNEIQSKYCVIWNPNIGPLGAWDTDDVKMVWSDDTLAECTSTRFGTFGIVVEIYEPPTVPDDLQWLLVTKMVGYAFSILLLTIFAISVLLSKYLWEMFHIIGMNFAFALLSSDIVMVLSELDSFRNDHDKCTLVGFGIHFFYVATSALLASLAFAVFMATTSGIIGGYTEVYLCIAWGIAFLTFGINVYSNLDIMGDDPRCMIGWVNEVKLYFGSLVLTGGVIALILMLVVMCNIHTSAMRKRSLVDELTSLAQGLTLLVLLFAITWIWFPLTYLHFDSLELPDFYPAFQVLNSWMGVFAFLGIGVGSKRFRTIVRGQAKNRQSQLMRDT